jgi:putative hydrolase of the HAD superfamily
MNFKYLMLDLDNTLYSKQSGMLKYIDSRIDDFIECKTGIPKAEIPQLRLDYLKRYGTTLGGMVAHHRIDPEEYMEHAYGIDVAEFIAPDPKLVAVLEGVKLQKVIFSNSPLEYIHRVLKVLEISRFFMGIYDIRFCNYLGKPNLSGYQKVLADLKAKGEECILVDDCVANVIGAGKAGITPVFLSYGLSPPVEWVIDEIYDLSGVIPGIVAGRISA